MSVLNKKGAQPRNREIKGKPFVWPKEAINNFNWVLPVMPKGFPLKNPKILRIFSNIYEPLKDDVPSDSCNIAAILSCEVRHPGEAAGCSMPPDVSTTTPGGTAPLFNFENIMKNFHCTDHVKIDVFDGTVFKHTTDPPTAVPDAPNTDFTYIEDLNVIIDKLVDANKDKYFVEKRSIDADDAVDLCTPKELTDVLGNYGPWVFSIFFIQNEIKQPNLWPSALTRYTQQRQPIDRWAKYHTEMGFNLYKSGIQQFTDGVTYTEDLVKRQESWNKIDQSALVGFTGDFVIQQFPTPYDKPSAEQLGLPYIVDYYQDLITTFFEELP